MPKQVPRTDRMAVDIQRALAELIRTEVEELHESLITITGVKVARDLGYADISVSILGGPSEMRGDSLTCNQSDKVKATLGKLKSYDKELRFALAKKVKLRVMPELRFHLDSTLTDANQIRRLIDEQSSRSGSSE